MYFIPYVFDKNNEKVSVSITPMTAQDADTTDTSPRWQTSWNSVYIQSSSYDKYAVHIGEELIALGAYEVLEQQLIVHIVYMEAHPESNPTMVGLEPKYSGIGRLLIAYGIKLSIDCGFSGDVVLEAKTPELALHYMRDFKAVPLPAFSGGAHRFLIADEAAKNIFCNYLSD